MAAGPDHVSAYALTVEPGTRLAARVRRGELAAPDDDVLADRYLVADDVLTAAGLGWYEISNWAAGNGSESSRCAHNELYWTGGDWWGIGPGAHSHVGGTRWWNVRHPAAYGVRIGAGPDHVSAYALTVEAGTRLAARVRRGELAAPDDDVLAERYLARRPGGDVFMSAA